MANREPKYKDETGNTHGWLKVLRYTRTDYNKGAMFECECKCGKILEVPGTRLRAGQRTSCGCKRHSHKKIRFSSCVICGSEMVYEKNMCRRCYFQQWREQKRREMERYL